jgi:hypothetical protein
MAHIRKHGMTSYAVADMGEQLFADGGAGSA